MSDEQTLVPAGAAQPPEVSAEASAAVESFIEALGGRTQLAGILRVGSGDAGVDRILRLLDDPDYRTWPTPKLCALAGLSVAEFLRAYQAACYAKAEITATRIITERMEAVVADVMQRAAPHDAPCPDCQGRKARSVKGIPAGPCATCGGTRKVQVLPPLSRQKVALELGKLLPKAGPLVQQNNLTLAGGKEPALPSRAGSLADFQQAVHDLLYPRRAQPARPAAIVEGTVVEGAAGSTEAAAEEAEASA